MGCLGATTCLSDNCIALHPHLLLSSIQYWVTYKWQHRWRDTETPNHKTDSNFDQDTTGGHPTGHHCKLLSTSQQVNIVMWTATAWHSTVLVSFSLPLRSSSSQPHQDSWLPAAGEHPRACGLAPRDIPSSTLTSFAQKLNFSKCSWQRSQSSSWGLNPFNLFGVTLW